MWARIKNLVGEISKLRVDSNIFTVGSSPIYTLDSSKVNYRMARELYDNIHEGYKLGAWGAKPVINTIVGFMGLPDFTAVDESAQDVLDSFFLENQSQIQQTHKNAIRDGDCWVWITREELGGTLYPEQDYQLVYNIIPPEQIKQIVRDPLTGKPIEYIFEYWSEWVDEYGIKKRFKILDRIDAQRRITKFEDGQLPRNVVFEFGESKNPWGFIPIVQFSNNKETGAVYGKSELEPLEPFFKVYHDIMMSAIKGAKLHNTPRLKLRVKDVARFLQVNFGVDDPVKFASEGRTIKLEGKELILLTGSEEDAEFVEASSVLGDTKDLLKLIFYCIVDVSETPEFAFGTHTPSSHASVVEQMPVLTKKIERKRAQFEDSWKQLARIVLAMESKSTSVRFGSHAISLTWEEVDPRDSKDVAQELSLVVEALEKAMRSSLISQKSAVDYLARYLDTMDTYDGGEREGIIETKYFMSGLEDAGIMQSEIEVIDKTLGEMGVN
jgi:hypothetical protein